MLKVVISGTCHGDALRNILESCPAFVQKARITFVPNCVRLKTGFGLAPVENLLPALSDCDVLVYHNVRDYDFPALIRSLPESSLAVEIPYVTSTIYWPTHDLKPFWLIKHGSSAYIPFPCHTLNRLIETCPDDAAVRRAYLRMDLPRTVNMDEVMRSQTAYLERIQAGTIFDFAGFTAEHYRSRQLFHLINHPAVAYFEMIADRIMAAMGIDGRVGIQPDQFATHQMPVHPSVIAYHGLTWCDASTRYNLHERTCDFEEYTDLYIHAYRERLAGS
jgi:hypothetical protein